MSKRRRSGDWSEFTCRLATNIQRLRIERGLSQEQVAYAAGMSRKTYQRLERGEMLSGGPVNPSLRNVMAVAQVLDVPLDELTPQPRPELGDGRARYQ